MRFDFATSQHIPFSSQPSVETEEKEVEVEEEASVAVGKEDDAATALVWDASDEDFFDRAFAAAAAARLLHQQTSSAAVSFSSCIYFNMSCMISAVDNDSAVFSCKTICVSASALTSFSYSDS